LSQVLSLYINVPITFGSVISTVPNALSTINLWSWHSV